MRPIWSARTGAICAMPRPSEPLVYDVADGTVKAHDDPSLRDPAITGLYEAQGQAGPPGVRAAARARRQIHAGSDRDDHHHSGGDRAAPGAGVRRSGPHRRDDHHRRRRAALPAGLRRLGEGHAGPQARLPSVLAAQAPEHRGRRRERAGRHPEHLGAPASIRITGGRKAAPTACWRTAGIIFGGPHPKPSRAARRPSRFAWTSANFSRWPRTSIRCSRSPSRIPQSFGLSYELEVLLHTPTNSLLGSFGDRKKVERLYQIAEIHGRLRGGDQRDDAVRRHRPAVPEPIWSATISSPAPANTPFRPAASTTFTGKSGIPVVEPAGKIRHPQEVIQEIADRLGILGDVYRLVNHTFRLDGNHALKPDQRYSAAEVVDRTAHSWFGEDHGLDWFRKNGVITLPQERRGSLYRSVPQSARADLSRTLPGSRRRAERRARAIGPRLGSLGLQAALRLDAVSVLRCPQSGEYDLIAVHFKFPYVYGSYGNENPWIDEICERTNAYNILLNEAVGKAKGIRDGDDVWLESPVRKVKATVKLTQCIHPEAVGVGGHFGHWSAGMPIASGKGVNFNSLLPTDIDHIDMISTALDHCVQVKVYK